MAENEVIIDVQHVSKIFKENKVLDNVSLKCESSKIYGIVGYNGSGKTVLFKCICGFYKVDDGMITIRGKQINRQIDMIEGAGIIIEEPAFLKYWNGYKNLEFLYGINNVKNKEHIENILRKVGLNPHSKKKVKHYSMGMRQRLAIAQAIMEEQDILILDEPMNGLDKQGVNEMRKLFLELKEEGKTILFASHNREDIEILCDEVYEMGNGKLSKIE